ncbi:MAG: (Fe-S)-binding protein, partial [Gammaproteobacteria bacterium]
MADFETPVTREFPIIPTIVEGAMSHSAPFLAAEEFQTDMGFPCGEETGQLIDGWKEKFLELLKDKLGKYRSLQVFMDT